jgi:hypothetical protein
LRYFEHAPSAGCSASLPVYRSVGS